jgi:hypothetical protein
MPMNVHVSQAPTIGMEEDGQPNGREWNNQCPKTVNEISAGIRLNFALQKGASWATTMDDVHVDEDILEGFDTHVGIWPTIQPDIIPPRLTRARQRLLELNTVVAHEGPLEYKDITAIDCLQSNLHDTMDFVFPPPICMDVARETTIGLR